MVSEVIIPVLDQTGDEVTITHWLKSEGDQVREGELLCEVEASKANVEIEAKTGGILRRILIGEGMPVPPLTVIAIIAGPDEPLPDIDPYYRARPSSPSPAVSAPSATQATASRSPSQARAPEQRVFASPRARRLATEHNIDLSTIEGTGTAGRIVEDDVRRIIEAVLKGNKNES